MNSRISYKVTALALAAMVTFIALAGINGLAASEDLAAQTQLAQALAGQVA